MSQIMLLRYANRFTKYCASEMYQIINYCGHNTTKSYNENLSLFELDLREFEIKYNTFITVMPKTT